MIRINIKRNEFPRMAARFERQVADVTNAAVLNLIMQADARTPVDTGQLRANKTTIFASPGNMTAKVTWNQDYSPYVHDGTSRMEGRPFAQDAVDAVVPGYLADLAKLGLT